MGEEMQVIEFAVKVGNEVDKGRWVLAVDPIGYQVLIAALHNGIRKRAGEVP